MSLVAVGNPFTQPPPALTLPKQGAFATKGQILYLLTPESTIMAPSLRRVGRLVQHGRPLLCQPLKCKFPDKKTKDQETAWISAGQLHHSRVIYPL